MAIGLLSSGTGVVPTPYCDCLCAPLVPVMIQSIRSARSDETSGYPPITNPYPDMLARLAGEPFTVVSSETLGQGGNGAFCKTSYNTAPSGGQVALSESTATSAPTDGTASPLLVQVQDFNYQWVVPLPFPWVGDGEITVHWRELTAHYDALINAADSDSGELSDFTVGDEHASLSFVDKSETLTPAAGATSVTGAVHAVLASSLNPGDTVTVTGPKEVGQFSTDAICGLNVQSVAASVEKNGFIPYLRADPSTPVQTLYALETASNASSYQGTPYTGYQLVDSGLQVGAAANGDAAYTFSGNVPSTLPSAVEPDTLGSCNLDLFPAQAQSVMAETVTFKNGLVLTLAQPIATGALLATANAQLAAPMTAEATATGGVLALRFQPADEISYAAKQSSYQPFLNVSVWAGIAGLDAPLATQDCTLAVEIDQVTTNLDTGASTTTTLTFNFDVPAASTNGTSRGPSQLGGNQGDALLAGGMLTLSAVAVPVPGSNQRLTWSNARLVGTCDRISWDAQATVS